MRILIIMLLSVSVLASDYDVAVSLIKNSRYETAQTVLEGAIKKGDAKPRHYHALGYTYEARGKKKVATEYYVKAFEMDVENRMQSVFADKAVVRIAKMYPGIDPMVYRARNLRRDAYSVQTGTMLQFHLNGAVKLLKHSVSDDRWERAKLQVGNFPEGTVEWNGHHYLLVAKKMSWHDAKKHCEALGGHLVTITSKEENEFVNEAILSTIPEKQFAYIGATDEHENGNWYWVTDERWGYTNWGDSQPDNHVDDQNYCAYSSSRGWVDMELKHLRIFICEWDD